VTATCVLVVDGAFLQRPELKPGRDYLIWLDIDADTMVAGHARARSSRFA
jgi:hypothetical protein